jgi:acyl-CoA synthetase (NDP forming)
MTADRCEELGLSVPPFPDDVQEHVGEQAPDLGGGLTNPVDQSILAGSGLGGGRVLEWLDQSDGIDLLVANVGEAWALGRPNAESIVTRVIDRFVEIGVATAKPFAVVMGPADYAEEWRRRTITEARERVRAANLAIFPSVERAMRAISRFVSYWDSRTP